MNPRTLNIAIPEPGYFAMVSHDRQGFLRVQAHIPLDGPETTDCRRAEPAPECGYEAAPQTDPLAEAAAELRQAKEKRDYLRKLLNTLDDDREKVRVELEAAGKNLDACAATLSRIACGSPF